MSPKVKRKDEDVNGKLKEAESKSEGQGKARREQEYLDGDLVRVLHGRCDKDLTLRVRDLKV